MKKNPYVEIVKSYVCRDCGEVDNPKKLAKGSMLVELFLWLMFIFPGMIYSVWRLSSKYDACRSCGSSRIVKASSPIGKKLIEDLKN